MFRTKRPSVITVTNYTGYTIHCRSLIEQTFGILKRRFALLKTGTRVRSMGKAASEILACCLLHNYGIDEGNNL